MIESYQFGLITIDGKDYGYDVWIDLQGRVNNWQRKESHSIGKEEVKSAAEEKPEILIIGTGAYGIAKVLEEVKDFLTLRGVRVIIKKTSAAVEDFNKFKREDKKVAALLHLTC